MILTKSQEILKVSYRILPEELQDYCKSFIRFLDVT